MFLSTRHLLNGAARAIRRVKRRLLPNVDPRHHPAALAYMRFVGRVARLDFLDDVEGHRMYLDPYDSLHLSVSRSYEPSETRLFQREIRPGQTIVDVGANIGYYTLLFARAVGVSGRVIALEPEPENFSLLQRNVELNGYRNVTLVNAAAWHEPTTLRLYLAPENKGDHRAYATGDSRPSVEVPALRLDDFLATLDLARVDWVKLDIQGAEYHAMRGLADTIRRSTRVAVATEFWPAGLLRAGASAAQYYDLLRSLGLDVYQIYDRADSLTPVTVEEILSVHTVENESFTNLLCRRPISLADA